MTKAWTLEKYQRDDKWEVDPSPLFMMRCPEWILTNTEKIMLLRSKPKMYSFFFFSFLDCKLFSNSLYYMVFSGEIILTFHNTHSFQINSCFESDAFYIIVSHLSDALRVICVHYFLMNLYHYFGLFSLVVGNNLQFDISM